MSKAFTKGQKVTYICSWDNKGTVAYRQAVVHSCGAKQMVLTDEVTGEEMGRHFAPVLGSLDNIRSFNYGGTFPRMSDDDAAALSLEVGAKVIEAVKADVEYRLTLPAYTKEGQAQRLAELHEPRALNYHAPKAAP